RGMLSNPRYRGWWFYGATQNVWQTKKDYSRQIARSEPLRSTQFEELRIVSDQLWYGAEKRLAEQDHAAVGRKPRDGNQASRPKLLNGLFRCAVHDRPLYVGGSYGQYLFCKSCRAMRPSERPLFSQLPRLLAVEMTCERLACLVKEDDELIAMVVTA